MLHETIFRPQKGLNRPVQKLAKLIIFFRRPRRELVLLNAEGPVRDLVNRCILGANDHTVPYRPALPINQRLARGEVTHADDPRWSPIVIEKHDVEFAKNYMI